MNILEAIANNYLDLDKDKYSVRVDHIVYEDNYDITDIPIYSGYFITRINDTAFITSPDYITLKDFIQEIKKLNRKIKVGEDY